MSAIRLGEGSGNLAVEYEGGGKATLPFFVSEEQGNIREFVGERIRSIFTSGTTFTGKIWPLW